MNEKIKILVDIDDTMANLSKAWCQELNRLYGTNVAPSDIKSWNLAKYFPEIPEEKVYLPLHSNSFWATVEPLPDASKYIKKLIDEGFDVYICTASFFDTIKSKFQHVLGRYFPYIHWNKVIVIKNKKMVKGDILIDDGIHNLEGGDYEKILMTAPHNESYDAEANGMTRANSWKEAYNAVHAYASRLKKGGEI